MPSDLSMRGRIGGLMRAARAPSATAMTAAPRQAALAKIYEEAGITPPGPDASDEELAEFERRKEAARRAHMTRLSRKAAQARTAAARAMSDAITAEAEIAANGDTL